MSHWPTIRKPKAELLAAHAAGELDGDPALASCKAEVERWLAAHPEDRPGADDRLLQELMQETRPADPDPSAFAVILEHLHRVPVPAFDERSLWARASVWLGLTAAAVWLAFAFWPEQAGAPPDLDRAVDGQPAVVAVDPFPVASSGEIEILSVEGSATASLVIGQPVHGPIELLAPGEVTFTSVQPAAGDNMLPRVHQPHETPMIWARVESEP